MASRIELKPHLTTEELRKRYRSCAKPQEKALSNVALAGEKMGFEVNSAPSQQGDERPRVLAERHAPVL